MVCRQAYSQIYYGKVFSAIFNYLICWVRVLVVVWVRVTVGARVMVGVGTVRG